MDEWVSVEERLPDIDMTAPAYARCVECLAATDAGHVVFVRYVSNGYAATEKGRAPRFEWHDKICPFKLTHWMPLPPAP